MKQKIWHRQLRSIEWELIPFGTSSQQGLNPIKLVYDTDKPRGWLELTVNTFNQCVVSVYQQSWSQLGIFFHRASCNQY